jgi:hypothetical protein
MANIAFIESLFLDPPPLLVMATASHRAPRSPNPPPKWIYERELAIIVHSDKECHDCDEWLTHYAISLEQEQDNASLVKARKRKARRSRVDYLTYDNMRRERDVAYGKLAATCLELEEMKRLLQEARDFRAAQNHISLLPPVQHEVIYVESDSDDVVPHTA